MTFLPLMINSELLVRRKFCEIPLREVRSRFQPWPVNCKSPYPLHKEIIAQSILLLGSKLGYTNRS